MLPRYLRLSACFCACLFTAACGVQKDLVSAEAAVTLFHQQLNNQDYATIYAQADHQMRSASKPDQFTALMSAVHNRLGRVETTKRQGFFVNYTTSGTQIRVTYETKFSGGDAQEQFVWGKRGENVALIGYNINSPTLITK